MKAEVQQILDDKIIPCEDIFIYLTAKYGEADCFVSANRELIKSIADFEQKFVRSPHLKSLI